MDLIAGLITLAGIASGVAILLRLRHPTLFRRPAAPQHDYLECMSCQTGFICDEGRAASNWRSS